MCYQEITIEDCDSTTPLWLNSLRGEIKEKVINLNPWLRTKLYRLGDDGFNNHLLGVCRSLAKNGSLSKDAIFTVLSACAESYDRDIPDSELLRAIAKAFDEKTLQLTTKSKWPSIDSLALESICKESPVRDKESLQEQFPTPRYKDVKDALKQLYELNDLLCLSSIVQSPVIKNLAEWLKEDLDTYQLIVPSPMTGKQGTNQDGKNSVRCLDNVGERKFLVIEFDKMKLNQQTAVIHHLAGFAPLVMVVFSGNDSLHAWFDCKGEKEVSLRSFMNYAVRLGADSSTFTKCQNVRTPAATRNGTKGNGVKQEVLILRASEASLEKWQLDKLTNIANEQSSGSFQLKHITDLTFDNTANDFVERLLGKSNVSVVYGNSNTGKSFWALSLAACVATGDDWRDREIDKGAVIYICLEGETGIRNRLWALKQEGLLSDDAPFYILSAQVDFLNDTDRQRLTSTVENLKRTLKTVRLVIVDTLSRAMAGGNENAGEDMTKLIQTVDFVKEATEAHVMLIHHCGKDAARGARGHSALRAAIDTEIEVTYDEPSKVATSKVVKQREFEKDGIFPFKLKVIELGLDTKNRPITSCVIEHLDESAAPKPRSGRKSEYDSQQLIELLPKNNVSNWQRAAHEEYGMSKGTFYKLKGSLAEGVDYRKETSGEILAQPLESNAEVQQ